MFRTIRRTLQQLPQEEAVEILKSSPSGVLALLGDDDYPYTVPMNHFYTPGHLYFHGAIEGHRADAVRRHGKASFCVIHEDEVEPATLSTRYRSVVVFGRIRLVEDAEEKRAAILGLSDHFAPAFRREAEKEIAESWDHLGLYALDIEHLTGKESKSLMQQRRGNK